MIWKDPRKEKPVQSVPLIICRSYMGRWMDVEDEVPDPGTRCLCTDGEDTEIMIYYGMNKDIHDWSSHNCNILDVKHWMPLPEPPNE